jgi:hypothetical protein
MTLTFQTNDAARAADQQQFIDWIRGYQVVDPGGGSNLVTAGTGDFEYDSASGDINAGGTIVTTSQETVDFQNDIDANDDQIAVIYRDTSGTLQKSIGVTGTREPSGDDIRSTHTPAAPTLFGTDGVLLAEVLLPAGASSIGSAELRDRRLAASLDFETVNALLVDLKDAAADPSANGEIQRNGTDIKVYSGGSVRNLSDVGAASTTKRTLTLSDTGKDALLDTDNTTGRVVVIDSSNDELSTWFIRGTNNDAQKLFDSNTAFTNSEDNDTTTNVYHDAGNSRYEINNETGGSVDYVIYDLRE